MTELVSCEVCGRILAYITRVDDLGEQKTLDCPHCGNYQISVSAEAGLKRLAASQRTRLSGWIRHHKTFGLAVPSLTVRSLNTVDSWLPNPSIASRTNELLRALAALSTHPGSLYEVVTSVDSPLAYAASAEELMWHLDALDEDRLVRLGAGTSIGRPVSLTPIGWQRVETGTAAVFPRAFVAMSFSDEMRACWNEGLKPGIEDAGYAAHRVDSDRHVQQIDQKIIADIRTSQFVVVDVTDHRQGVYFEAGFALGLGKTVIWTVRKKDLKKSHFDTRQFAHICWETHEQLREQLRDTIIAVLGAGPNWRPTETDPSIPQP